MISLITTGRDDDYGKNFLNRLYTSISKNIEGIKQLNIPYEYLVVEWCPFKNYLINHPDFEDLFKRNNIVDIIVKPVVGTNEKLNPKIFYEYFAKNAGVRRSNSDFLIILNSDIVLPMKTIELIGEAYKDKAHKNHFYRPIYRVQVNDNLEILKKECVHYPSNPDAVICGYCSGDILIVNKNAFISYGQGYDETNPRHRTVSQAGMDGEILWNLHRNNITLKFLDSEYWHINHEKPNTYDGTYNTNGYNNKTNWGFIDYPQNIISEKLIEIG